MNVANVYFAEIEILWDNSETGIDEIASGLNFSVYPNPTEGVFNINLSEDALNSFDVNIMDVTGRAIYSRTIGSNEVTIDLNNQDAGMYFVHINAEGKAATRTLILK